MKVLVITPKLPYPATGADEQDRFYGIKMLKDIGFEVRVIAKIKEHQSAGLIEHMQKELGVSVRAVPYMQKRSFKRFLNPYLIDGAAFEYTDPKLKEMVTEELKAFSPDLVWVDGSYAWPIAEYAKNRGVKTILRSLNIESRHLLTDEGFSPLNLLRAFSKELGERSLNKRANIVFAITEIEKALYRKRGVHAQTLPLRSLPYIFKEKPHLPKRADILKVVYSGSTYSVGHNRMAAEFIIRKIVPKAVKALNGKVSFHITGAKLPKEITNNLGENVIYEGYVHNYKDFLLNADVVLAPSLGGAGMQQKIFEPVTRGIPTITSSRGLAGYDFKNEQHLFVADTAEEAVAALKKMQDIDWRRKLGKQGRAQAGRIFSEKVIRALIMSKLH